MSKGAAGFKLPILRILRDTFLIPGRNKREFFKPLALPGLLIVVLTLGWQLTRSSMPAPVGWLILVFTVPPLPSLRLRATGSYCWVRQRQLSQ